MNNPDSDYEEIAARIHGFYLKSNLDSDYAEYAKLPEFLKADNREAAIRIGRVLAMAGLRLEPRGDTGWSEADQATIRQTIEENIALLAEAEHDGWTAARLRHGWTPGHKKDLELRESHLLVGYPDLLERIKLKQQAVGPELHKDGLRKGEPMTPAEEFQHEKNKDANSVRKYVDIIGRTGYRIVVEE